MMSVFRGSALSGTKHGCRAGKAGNGLKGIPLVLRQGSLLLFALVMCVALGGSPGALAAGRQADQRARAAEDTTPPVLADFSRTAVVLEAEGPAKGTDTLQQGVVYRLPLPAAVQLGTRLSSGADMAVFNGEGKGVPFTLRRQERENTDKVTSISTLYPLWGKGEGTSGELVVGFTLDKDARLIPKVFEDGATGIPEGQALKGYVIPLPEGGFRADVLEVAWEKDRESTVRFSVETGPDLVSWRSVNPAASLVRIEGPEGSLDASSVPLNGARLDKYLRLLFAQGAAPKSISSLRFVERVSYEALENTGSLQGTRVAAQTDKNQRVIRPEGLEFVLPAGPRDRGTVSAYALQPVEPPLGLYSTLRILTRRDGDDNWRLQGQYTFFSIKKENELFQSPPVSLHGDRVGQIRLEAAGGGTLPDLVLRVDYFPQSLYFLAQGRGPFTLGWHSGRKAATEDAGLYSLIGKGAEVRLAGLGEMRQNASSPAEQEGSGFFSGKSYLLWAVLGLGVLLLAIMALQLSKNMRKTGS